MNRIQQKIKDLIEVRSYEGLQDYISDPAKTVSSYHFTDITSELMANWLNSLSVVQSQDGAAKALAGYRGVGKSHFLATLGAIISNPELRSKIADQHVISSAQHLKRRRYPVAYVQRGLYPTLVEELKFGISNCLGIEESQIPNDKKEIIEFVANNAGDLPFVILVDTAFGRESRVNREDGATLGELAEIAKQYNVFIAVALDDDITNADGVNSAIAQSYTIDYLDQEHLYKIVNTDIFPKHRQTQSVIQQIYTNFKDTLPSFRWSEQRFNSLYPLHPSILEIAPFIRLYAPEFALLSFASEAGARILGRPANSLIALDEVFDSIENTLRKSEDLEEVFAAYDKINKEVISEIPVMQRLQGKLILKALLILSLDGDGTSASEIAATMLIFNENDPEGSIKLVEELLETFAKALPDEIWSKPIEGQETRFSFKLSKKDSLNTRLSEVIENVPEKVISGIFKKVSKDRFQDWHLSTDESEEKTDWADCPVIWRGSVRRVRLHWNWGVNTNQVENDKLNTDLIDLEIFISNSQNKTELPVNSNNVPRAVWQTAKLKNEEIDTVKRFSVLLNDQNLREEFQEQVRAAGHTHMVAVEQVWNRIFIKESKFLINDNEFSFPEHTGGKLSLSKMLSKLLSHYFDCNYPEHPIFNKILAMNDVSKLVNDLFSGARINHENVQELAESFALPLGLVAKRGENFVLETEENLFNLPLAEKVINLVGNSPDGKVSLDTIYHSLKEQPFGVVRESQHLILAALVAQRKIEFITSKGDRINRRSLDLKILWDDIDGVAKPASITFDSKKLAKWARLVTKSEKIESVDNPQDRNVIKESLKKWLDDWKNEDLLQEFNQLPDEILNIKIWQYSTNTEKSFGIVANTIDSYFNEAISLEEALQRFADAFSDSESEFLERTKDLMSLKNFVEGAALREKIWSYLAVCESTQDIEIEEHRDNLMNLIELSSVSPDAQANVEMNRVWEKFHSQYKEHFAIKHDAIMKSHQLQEKFDEILKSDEWWEFESLSKLPIFQSHFWTETQKILKQFKDLDCSFDVRENLNGHPFCACSFNLAKTNEWDNLPKNLTSIINTARESYRKTLIMMSDILIQLVEPFSKDETNEKFNEASIGLLKMFTKKENIELFSIEQLIILKKVLEDMHSSPLLNVQIPQSSGLQSTAELRAKINSWLDELPKEPVLLKL